MPTAWNFLRKWVQIPLGCVFVAHVSREGRGVENPINVGTFLTRE